MPLNFYSFLIANMLAEREFEDKNVPNKARAQQLGLVASVFSPGGGGGLGSSVIPAVLVQQTARREAEEAANQAATRAVLSTSSGLQSGGGTPGGETPGAGGDTSTGGDGTGGGDTGTGGEVTQDEFQALRTQVNNLAGLLAEYHDVKGKTFAEAKALLKEFHVLTFDDMSGGTGDDTTRVVKTQFPEFKPGMRLLRGMGVAIMEDPPLKGTSEGDPGWGEKP